MRGKPEGRLLAVNSLRIYVLTRCCLLLRKIPGSWDFCWNPRLVTLYLTFLLTLSCLVCETGITEVCSSEGRIKEVIVDSSQQHLAPRMTQEAADGNNENYSQCH